HLRQVGTMILAVPKLEQAFGRHVGRCRCGVDADNAASQVVDAQHGRSECAFTRAPTFSHAEIIKDCRQPIIGEVARADLDADAPPERARMFFDPRLDTIGFCRNFYLRRFEVSSSSLSYSAS